MEQEWNEIDRETKELGEQPAALSTTNLTWTDIDTNPGFRGEKPATSHLIYGMANQGSYS
jgi:hypothetical protein